MAVLKSETKTRAFVEKTSGSFSLGVDYLRVFGVGVELSHVKSVAMTFRNAEVWEIPDSAIEASLSRIGGNCQKAIDTRLAHHRIVAVVQSVLRADVVYDVDFDDAVGASVKATFMANLAAKLGGKVSSQTSTQVKGERLFWGIVANTDFFSPRGEGGEARLSVVPPVLVPGGPPIGRIEAKGVDTIDYP
jgi:hypothetical protein